MECECKKNFTCDYCLSLETAVVEEVSDGDYTITSQKEDIQ